MQIAEQFRALGAAISARVTLVVGGMERTKQSQLLSKRPHIVVATPGRLVDLLLQDDHRGLVAGLRFLVLDEADRLLDPAFAPALGQLLPVLPAKRYRCSAHVVVVVAVPDASNDVVRACVRAPPSRVWCLLLLLLLLLLLRLAAKRCCFPPP
jgi:ATP-dependent RNA helicase DDX49/DBP8